MEYGLIGCPSCYSVKRRDKWYNVGKSTYREVESVVKVKPEPCSTCYQQVSTRLDARIEHDLDMFFDRCESGKPASCETGIEARVRE